MSADLNGSVSVRAGEEIPADKLAPYLKQHLPAAEGELTVEQFPHGHSNLTYLVRIGSRELVLRRPPFGNQVKSAHDMGREYRVLSRLCQVYPPAPRPYLYCDDETILGAPFYLMERRHGLILRKGGRESSFGARQLSTALIDNLAVLHSIDYRAAGLAELGKPDGYVERQVTGWTNRYAQSKTGDVPPLDPIARWLADHLPSESGAAVIHNDYKYDNLLLAAEDPTRIVAVLDWEMATIGDPLMDLGTTLGYWVEAGDPIELQRTAFGPTALPGSLTRRELVDRYQQQSGRNVADALFYYCFGLFKIAVIIQQIYVRYVRGHTQDPRFAQLHQLVTVLRQQADQKLDSGQL
jgi:aminoglycoside phosphotransferase (APT) family kinase protein